LELRLKKFGGEANETTKKDLRAKRFGNEVVSNSGGAPVGKDVLDKRAQRFGGGSATAPSSPATAVVSPEVLKKRAERFGAVVEEKPAVVSCRSPLETISSIGAKRIVFLKN
jgi:hypothetical protein